MPVVVVGAAVALSAGRYLLGCLVLAVVLASVGWGSWELRRALFTWRGAPARLVETVIGFTALTLTAYALGAVHEFRGPPLLVAYVVVGLALGVVARRVTWRRGVVDPDPEHLPRSRRWEVGAAAVAVTVVGAQWLSQVASALGRGMTETDTLWYHAVFPVRFVQLGRLDILPDVGAFAQSYFPANSQMYHALAYFPFDRDLLSPMLNIVFAAMTVLAAYCIGRRRGVGALCVLGAAAMLGLPAIAGTHPGQATSDLSCAAFLVVAVALLVEGGLHPLPVGFASAAAALSLGTKLTVALPITVLTVVIIFLAVRRRRPALVAAWILPLAVIGSFWFIRNWAYVDNPLPWYHLSFGPFDFRASARLADQASIADRLTDGSVYRTIFIPGLRRAFGELWPLIVVSPAVAGLAVLGRDRRVVERLAAIVTIGAGIGYILMPFTMELHGAIFAETTRYASPVLALALAMLPIALMLDRAPALARAALAAALGLVIGFNVFAHRAERFTTWAAHDRLLGIALACAVAAVVVIYRMGPRVLRRVTAVMIVVAVLVGGAVVQRHYLERRYVNAGLALDSFYAYLQVREPARIVAFGTFQLSPLFGPSDRNEVMVVSPPSLHLTREARCRAWKRTIVAARPDYVLFASGYFAGGLPTAAWFAGDPAARRVLSNRFGVLLHVSGRLSTVCPPG